MNCYRKIFQLILAAIILISVGSASAEKSYEISTIPLERDGYNLNLRKLQVAGATPTKNILMIHGLTYSSHVFDVDFADYSLARFFARKGYAVWLLDLTGYGQSEKISDGFKTTSDGAAEDINAAVDKINVGKIDLLGWSFGTVTTSKFAAKYPEKVRKLILYAPILSGLGEKNISEPFNKNTWQHAADDFQKLTNGEIDFKMVEPAVANTFLADCWKYDEDSSPNGWRVEIFSPKSTRLIRIENLKCPVLIIEGTRDAYINRSALSEAVKNLPPDSEFVEFAGGSHILVIEKPFYKKFRETLIKFLEK